MGYVLSEEQQFLKDAAVNLYKKAPVSLVRELRDTKDTNGYSTSLWQEMVESGWPGVAVSEASGGMDFGARSLGILMEESGRTLSASPLLGTALAARILEKFTSDAQVSLIEQLMSGSKTIGLALQEGNFYSHLKTSTSIRDQGGTIVLNGEKNTVLDAHIADQFIVSAQSDSGNLLLLIDSTAEGLQMEKDFFMDSRYYGRLQLNNVQISKDNILVAPSDYEDCINEITNWSSALLSAELVGIMSESFDRTIAYLKERRQFDRHIGSFQALQHRAADLYGEIELAQSISIKALDALDNNTDNASALCSMAKAKCINVSKLATNEGVQMFGGIGMTDDEEIGFFMKRARVASQLFGGLSYHLDRYATLNAF